MDKTKRGDDGSLSLSTDVMHTPTIARNLDSEIGLANKHDIERHASTTKQDSSEKKA